MFKAGNELVNTETNIYVLMKLLLIDLKIARINKWEFPENIKEFIKITEGQLQELKILINKKENENA